MYKTMMNSLDDFYYWLKLKINDDDSVFGSRQLFVFVITLCLYIGVTLTLIIRGLMPTELIPSIKPFIIILIAALYIFLLKVFFKRYSKTERISFNPTKNFSLANDLLYIFMIFAPILVLSMLYLK
jgi:uncharacterized membrane-anchored protein